MKTCLAILLWAALLSGSTGKERLLQEYDDLAARAHALVGVVDNMEASLRQQGSMLHPDIVEAREHVVSAINSAAEARDNQDWPLLRKRLDRARGFVEQLRRKL